MTSTWPALTQFGTPIIAVEFGRVSHKLTPKNSGAATATALTITEGGAAVSSVSQGTVVTLTATVTAEAVLVSPGQVKFCDAAAAFCTGSHLLGASTLTTAGIAVLKLQPGPGSHSFNAVFEGTTSRQESISSAAPLAVTGASQGTFTNLTATGAPGNYTLTATVSGSGQVLPTGQVSFQDVTNANYVLASGALIGGSVGLSSADLAMPGTNPVPYGIAIGDYNRDGIADMAVADANLNYVVIWLGKGDGTFRQGQTVATQALPTTVVTADFDGDGKLDLAVSSNYGSGLNVLLGNGDGTFAAATSVEGGNYAESVAVGDFDGDGRLDLAVSDYVGDTVTILLGNGDGTFRQSAQVPVAGGPQAIVTADFNGDGKADLMVGTLLTNGLVELLGNGDGTFTVPTVSPTSAYSSLGFASMAVGDFNGDGIADLAFPSQFSFVSILLGVGDGTFTAAPLIASGFLSESVAVGDLNGDGIQDLVVGVGDLSGSNYAVPLLGQGDGTFIKSATTPTGKQPAYSAVGDLNGDGLADAVTANSGSGDLTVLLSAATATATATVTGISPVGTGTHMADAVYGGDSTFTRSTSNTVTLTAEQQVTTLGLIASSVTSASGQSVVLTATVSPSIAQNHTPTNSVAFMSNGASIGTAALSNGVATLTVSTLSVGTDDLVAMYAGDTNFATSTSSSLPHTVTQQTSAAQNITFPQPSTPDYAGSSINLNATASSGLPVTFSVLSGPASISGTTLSFTAPGTVVVAADQKGNSSFSPASEVTRSITVIARLSSVNLTLSAGPSSVFLSNPVTLTAVVSGPAGMPTGTMTFLDGSVPLGSTAAIGGTASLVTGALTLGMHSIVASYSGSSNYAPLISSGVIVTVQDFALTATNPNVTIIHGGTATYSLMLSSVGGVGMASTVNFSISGAPDGSQITFTPQSIPAGSGTARVTLVMHTPNYPSGPFSMNNASKSATISLAFIALGGLLLPFRRNRMKIKSRITRMSAMLLLIGTVGVVLGGCGSGWRTQDWVINVTATSGKLSHTTTVYLISKCQDQQAACPVEN